MTALTPMIQAYLDPMIGDASERIGRDLAQRIYVWLCTPDGQAAVRVLECGEVDE